MSLRSTFSISQCKQKNSFALSLLPSFLYCPSTIPPLFLSLTMSLSRSATTSALLPPLYWVSQKNCLCPRHIFWGGHQIIFETDVLLLNSQSYMQLLENCLHHELCWVYQKNDFLGHPISPYPTMYVHMSSDPHSLWAFLSLSFVPATLFFTFPIVYSNFRFGH